MPAKTAFVALGANLGDREGVLQAALARMNEIGVRVTAVSSFYETEPQGLADQPWFLNAVVCCETELEPLVLLEALRTVERDFGRVRNEEDVRNGPRTLDLDILLYDDVRLQSQELTIPHPRLLQRRFVLQPLLEIAPAARLPSGEAIAQYLGGVGDQRIRKWR